MTSLYRFYDAGDTLLYVGITNNLPARSAEHSRDKAWFTTVARVEVEHYATRQEAVDAERRAITTEGPRHNVVHNGKTVVAVTPSPRASASEYPVAVDDVVALGCHDGKCPVGYVDWVGAAGVRVLLVSWMSGVFGADVRLVPWDAIGDVRWGRVKERDGLTVVYDLDPLADFQDEWMAASA